MKSHTGRHESPGRRNHNGIMKRTSRHTVAVLVSLAMIAACGAIAPTNWAADQTDANGAGDTSSSQTVQTAQAAQAAPATTAEGDGEVSSDAAGTAAQETDEAGAQAVGASVVNANGRVSHAYLHVAADGQEPFNAPEPNKADGKQVADKQGNDSSADNARVRSFDDVDYVLTVMADGLTPGNKVTYGLKATLPYGSNEISWETANSSFDTKPAPTVTYIGADGTSKTAEECAYATTENGCKTVLSGWITKDAATGSGDQNINLRLHVLAMHEGQKIRPDMEVWINGGQDTADTQHTHATDDPEAEQKHFYREVTVTSETRVNVTLSPGAANPRAYGTYGFDTKGPNQNALKKTDGKGTDGILIGYGVGIQLRNYTGTDAKGNKDVKFGLRGVDIPNPGSDLEVQVGFETRLNGKTLKQYVEDQDKKVTDPTKKRNAADFDPIVYSIDANESRAQAKDAEGNVVMRNSDRTLTSQYGVSPEKDKMDDEPKNSPYDETDQTRQGKQFGDVVQNGGTWSDNGTDGSTAKIKVSGWQIANWLRKSTEIDTKNGWGQSGTMPDFPHGGFGFPNAERYYDKSLTQLNKLEEAYFSAGEVWVFQPLEDQKGLDLVSPDAKTPGEYTATITATETLTSVTKYGATTACTDDCQTITKKSIVKDAHGNDVPKTDDIRAVEFDARKEPGGDMYPIIRYTQIRCQNGDCTYRGASHGDVDGNQSKQGAASNGQDKAVVGQGDTNDDWLAIQAETPYKAQTLNRLQAAANVLVKYDGDALETTEGNRKYTDASGNKVDNTSVCDDQNYLNSHPVNDKAMNKAQCLALHGSRPGDDQNLTYREVTGSAGVKNARWKVYWGYLVNADDKNDTTEYNWPSDAEMNTAREYYTGTTTGGTKLKLKWDTEWRPNRKYVATLFQERGDIKRIPANVGADDVSHYIYVKVRDGKDSDGKSYYDKLVGNVYQTTVYARLWAYGNTSILKDGTSVDDGQIDLKKIPTVRDDGTIGLTSDGTADGTKVGDAITDETGYPTKTAGGVDLGENETAEHWYSKWKYEKEESGIKYPGTGDSGVNKGDSLLILPYFSHVTIQPIEKDTDGKTATNFKIDQNQREADFEISPSLTMKSNHEAGKTNVTITAKLPKGFTYKDGSSYFGGTYKQARSCTRNTAGEETCTPIVGTHGKVEGTDASTTEQVGDPDANGNTGGRMAVEPEVKENDDGTTTLTWTIEDVTIKGGPLPKIHYGVTIGNPGSSDDVKNNQNFTTPVWINTTEDRRPSGSGMGETSNNDNTTIGVHKDDAKYVYKYVEDPVRELNDPIAWHLGMVLPDSVKDPQDAYIIDVMPYQGDEVEKNASGEKVDKTDGNGNTINTTQNDYSISGLRLADAANGKPTEENQYEVYYSTDPDQRFCATAADGTKLECNTKPSNGSEYEQDGQIKHGDGSYLSWDALKAKTYAEKTTDSSGVTHQAGALVWHKATLVQDDKGYWTVDLKAKDSSDGTTFKQAKLFAINGVIQPKNDAKKQTGRLDARVEITQPEDKVRGDDLFTNRLTETEHDARATALRVSRTISGRAWLDPDRDGLQDKADYYNDDGTKRDTTFKEAHNNNTEKMMPGIKVSLMYCDTTGAFNAMAKSDIAQCPSTAKWVPATDVFGKKIAPVYTSPETQNGTSPDGTHYPGDKAKYYNGGYYEFRNLPRGIFRVVMTKVKTNDQGQVVDKDGNPVYDANGNKIDGREPVDEPDFGRYVLTTQDVWDKGYDDWIDSKAYGVYDKSTGRMTAVHIDNYLLSQDSTRKSGVNLPSKGRIHESIYKGTVGLNYLNAGFYYSPNTMPHSGVITRWRLIAGAAALLLGGGAFLLATNDKRVKGLAPVRARHGTHAR